MTRQERALQSVSATQAGVARAAAPFPRTAVVSLREGCDLRLERIERFELSAGTGRLPAAAALPAGYAKSRWRKYPVLILLGVDRYFGSMVEMSRMLAASKEVAPCIVVNIETAADDPSMLAALIAQCLWRYRIDAREVCIAVDAPNAPALLRSYAQGIAGVTRCILATQQSSDELLALIPVSKDTPNLAWTVVRAPSMTDLERSSIHWKIVPEASAASLMVPALIHGLRSFWGTRHRYGDEVAALSGPLLTRVLCALAPFLRRLTGRKQFAAEAGKPHIIRAPSMARDFEIFVALPPGAADGGGRRYPLIVALDANGCFATMSEMVSALALAGEIPEAIVVGIGTPRNQGELEFGYRRFEELSPPPRPDYRYDDELGRFFRSAFALRGEDARLQLGLAPAFHDFIANELLPQLVSALPIDPAAMTLIGHSAAGAFVGYAVAQPQSPFSAFLCLSPGVGIGDDWMLRNVDQVSQRQKPARVFCALGAEELGNRFNQVAGIPRTAAYADALRARGIDVLGCHAMDGETHTTVFARAVAMGLRAVLAPAKLAVTQ